MAPNRIVALLTPLVFAPLAGAIASWTAKHFPGFEVSQSALEEVFIAGALIALAPAAQWLHGWQKYEARQAEAEQAVELAAAAATGPALAGAAGGAETGLDDVAGVGELDELADLDDELLADEDALDDELLAEEDALDDELLADEDALDDELLADEDALDDEPLAEEEQARTPV